MPQAHISRAVLDRLRALPGYPGLQVLDLSCGDGEILTCLQREGCTGRGTRYRPDDYILSSHDPPPCPIDEDVDLTATLPYQAETFDVVLLVEVLEHLELHHVVLAEAARVLRPGGRLLFTTPNLQRVHSRWHFFLTGTHKLIRRPVGWDVSADASYAYHMRCVDFPVIHTRLHQVGLQVAEVGWTHFKWRHAPWLILYPLFMLAARRQFRGRTGANDEFRRGQEDLRRWMMHPAMLASEQLLVVARKGNGDAS